jgi:predicted ATPase
VVDLACRKSNLPLLIVCLARHSLFERRPEWGKKISTQIRLDLRPLPEEDSRALVAEILRLIDPLPQVLLDLVSTRAEGNPFYAEELIKMLIDDGVILTSEETWKIVPDQLVTLKVPAALTGVLQARLDKLQPLEKKTAQQAAVIGRIFWDQALAAIEVEGPKSLPPLQTKEFIFHRKESAFAGAMEYIFKHALLRDVAYETVLKRDRKKYHVLVADWLATAAEDNGRGDEYAALIGEHYQLAGESMQTAYWYGRAGQQAYSSYSYDDALHYLNLALEFTPKNDKAAQFALLDTREKVHNIQGNREAQEMDIEELASLAEGFNFVSKVKVALKYAEYANKINNYQQAINHCQYAIEWGKHEGTMDLVTKGYRLWAWALYRQGEFPSSKRKYQTGLKLAQDIDNQKEVAYCLNGLGVLAKEMGEFAKAIEHYKQVLTIFQDIGDRYGEGGIQINLGNLSSNQGDYDTAG